jgi:acyl dehydratase
MRYTALEKRVLASRPDVGMSKILAELRNETGETMATWRTNQLTRMRHPDPVARPGTTGARRGVVSLWEWNGLPQAPAATGCFLEDRQIGETSDLGGHRFNKDAMIAFARQFDPQPFHLDEEAAKASLFGNLSASGWQTAAYLIRLVVLARQRTAAEARAAGVRMAAYGPSPGFTNLLWPKPVFVGDTVEYRTRVVGKVDLTSRPDRGVLVEEAQGRNQKGEIVLALTTQILVERRLVDGAYPADEQPKRWFTWAARNDGLGGYRSAPAAIYLNAAAIFPPSTVTMWPVVARALARLTKACATSAAATSRLSRLPPI